MNYSKLQQSKTRTEVNRQVIRSTNGNWESHKEHGRLKEIKPSWYWDSKTGQNNEKKKMLQSRKRDTLVTI